ncbi:hypothetical protein DM860_017154 [Cuscuta australis]|uniref:Arf-GAP domain-containing protein n=1 Tax=Cuscuta australis TaxID=267555 RepID=A0A328DTW2_9ASTE|nr:hypothetical protein DM860_017154 [Cuscuta australis]
MNNKSSVSKELNAKHTKILEGLLKLPENRECADCRSRAPRWASINLGIFICMQCSGIHRSLGVHISQVRSTTLDTWLPDQVALMQCMGNEKANSYWEALLPLDSDRSDIEKFIRAKYEDKKWVSEGVVQPTDMVNERHSNCHKPTENSGRIGIPRKARKYSLEEDILDTNKSQGAPSTTRPRWASVDMTDNLSVDEPPPNDVSVERQPSRKSDTAKDLFSLLYAPEIKQDRVVVPPSRWATFE